MNFSIGLGRFCRFCIAGFGNTALHYLVAWSAFEFAGVVMPVANLLGCVAATLLSYFVNSIFVFHDAVSARKLARFTLVNSGVLVFAYFAGVFTAYLSWPMLVAVIMTSAFGVTTGFAAHSLITFRRRSQRHTP